MNTNSTFKYRFSSLLDTCNVYHWCKSPTFFFQPVQGFDYAKQHLGQQGTEDDVLPVTQETVVLPLPVRDAPASQEREIVQDGSTAKTAKSNDTKKRSAISTERLGFR